MAPSFLDLPEDIHVLFLEAFLRPHWFNPLNDCKERKPAPDLHNAIKLCSLSRKLYLKLTPHLWRLHRHAVTLESVWRQGQTSDFDLLALHFVYQRTMNSWLLAARNSRFFPPGQLGRSVANLTITLNLPVKFNRQREPDPAWEWLEDVAVLMRETVDAYQRSKPSRKHVTLPRSVELAQNELLWTIVTACPNVVTLEAAPLLIDVDLLPEHQAANMQADMWTRLRSLDLTFHPKSHKGKLSARAALREYLSRCAPIPPLDFLGVELNFEDGDIVEPASLDPIDVVTRHLELRIIFRPRFHVWESHMYPSVLTLSGTESPHLDLRRPVPISCMQDAALEAPAVRWSITDRLTLAANFLGTSRPRRLRRLFVFPETDLGQSHWFSLNVQELHVVDTPRCHHQGHRYGPTLHSSHHWLEARRRDTDPSRFLRLFDTRYLDFEGNQMSFDACHRPPLFRSLHLWGCSCTAGRDCCTTNVRQMRLAPWRDRYVVTGDIRRRSKIARAFGEAVRTAGFDVFVGDQSEQFQVLVSGDAAEIIRARESTNLSSIGPAELLRR